MLVVMDLQGAKTLDGCQHQEFLIPLLQLARTITPMNLGESGGKLDHGFLTRLQKLSIHTFWDSVQPNALFSFWWQKDL